MYNTRIKSFVVRTYNFWIDQNMTLVLLAQTSTARFIVEYSSLLSPSLLGIQAAACVIVG